MNCIFCDMDKEKYIVENELAYGIFDGFPVNKGHVLIIPKRHFESFFEASKEELSSIHDLLEEAKVILDREYGPDGYNIGINVGERAGQSIFHLHVHLIPRYAGDVELERLKGGIRNFKESVVPY